MTPRTVEQALHSTSKAWESVRVRPNRGEHPRKGHLSERDRGDEMQRGRSSAGDSLLTERTIRSTAGIWLSAHAMTRRFVAPALLSAYASARQCFLSRFLQDASLPSPREPSTSARANRTASPTIALAHTIAVLGGTVTAQFDVLGGTWAPGLRPSLSDAKLRRMDSHLRSLPLPHSSPSR